MIDLDALEALAEKATPGPWEYHAGGGHAYNSIRGSESVQVNGWKERRAGFSNASYSDMVCENLGSAELEGPQSNVALICTLRNALPELLALARDGQRYRWLRGKTNAVNACEMVVNENIGHDWARVMNLDAAIDAAMKEVKP